MSEEWVAAELSGSAAVRSSMAGIDLVGARVDLVGARMLLALSSLAACTRPWWPRTTTTARICMPPPHANTARITTTACGPSGGRRELVRMWPPEFWKELAWWPTGARSDVAAGDLAELAWWPPLAGDLAELASSSSAASPSS